MEGEKSGGKLWIRMRPDPLNFKKSRTRTQPDPLNFENRAPRPAIFPDHAVSVVLKKRI